MILQLILELTPERLKKIPRSWVKRKNTLKMWSISLRIVTITLNTGEKEVLLTNLPQNIMSKDDFRIISTVKDGELKQIITLWKIDFYI